MEAARQPNLVFLCTGNAARSVMAALMFRARCSTFRVSGAGTHALPGHPMSVRTRRALATVGLADPTHRSAQLDAIDVSRADAVIAMAPEHVAYVRRVHPEGAPRTATIKRLVRDLPAPDGRSVAERLLDLDLHAVELEPWEEVRDPAGGEQPDYDACAAELDVLVRRLHDVLGCPS